MFYRCKVYKSMFRATKNNRTIVCLDKNKELDVRNSRVFEYYDYIVLCDDVLEDEYVLGDFPTREEAFNFRSLAQKCPVHVKSLMRQKGCLKDLMLRNRIIVLNEKQFDLENDKLDYVCKSANGQEITSPLLYNKDTRMFYTLVLKEEE